MRKLCSTMQDGKKLNGQLSLRKHQPSTRSVQPKHLPMITMMFGKFSPHTGMRKITLSILMSLESSSGLMTQLPMTTRHLTPTKHITLCPIPSKSCSCNKEFSPMPLKKKSSTSRETCGAKSNPFSFRTALREHSLHWL